MICAFDAALSRRARQFTTPTPLRDPSERDSEAPFDEPTTALARAYTGK